MARRKSTKGTRQVGAEVAEGLLDEFKAFCEGRNETVRHHLELAMRRHLDNPPPVAVVPPLPPVTAPGEKPAKGKKKK
jgi:hypothetical protein